MRSYLNGEDLVEEVRENMVSQQTFQQLAETVLQTRVSLDRLVHAAPQWVMSFVFRASALRLCQLRHVRLARVHDVPPTADACRTRARM